MSYPPCFESQLSFDSWIELASQSGIKEPEKNFCVDCTYKYQSLALRANVCTRPETVFVSVTNEDGEGEVVGASLDMVVE